MEELNFSRTEAVSFNATDLNRIEEWTEALSSYLNSLGYSVKVFTKKWTQKDIPWKDEVDRIRENVEKLYKAFQYNPDWRKISYSGSLNYREANDIEWDLNSVYIWLNRMAAVFIYSNDCYSNEGGIA